MRIGVTGNRRHVEIGPVLEKLEAAAGVRDLSLHLSEALHGVRPVGEMPLEGAWDRIDVLLTLGGDGTLLRGARMAAPRGIPVLGCNLGRLGFLTAAPVEALEQLLDGLVADELAVEARTALDVRVLRDGPPAEPDGGTLEETFYALNDAVVHKSGFARLMTLRVWVDDEEIGQYSADGIVVSTATGSTAYSLSAGGPILAPQMDALVATPICPHTLAVRSLVLPGDARITVQTVSDATEAVVTVDGQSGSRLSPTDRVEVAASDTPVRLVRFPEHTFFSVLRRKLRWGDVRPRND